MSDKKHDWSKHSHIPPRQIFIKFDGNNYGEITRLRKEWQPPCDKCDAKMPFQRFLKQPVKIGQIPRSAHYCKSCKRHYFVEVDDAAGYYLLGHAYHDDPEHWENNTSFEDLINEIKVMKPKDEN